MEIGPGQMFEKELSSVFVRWWEESDLEDYEMAQIALDVTERFCGTDVEFESDIDLSDIDDE